ADGKAGLVHRRRVGGWNGRCGTGGIMNGIRHEKTLPCRYGLGNAALATVRVGLGTWRPGSGSPTVSGTRGSWISRPPCGSAPFAALTPQSHTAESAGTRLMPRLKHTRHQI